MNPPHRACVVECGGNPALRERHFGTLSHIESQINGCSKAAREALAYEILFGHYRTLMTKDEAEKIFSLTPDAVSNAI